MTQSRISSPAPDRDTTRSIYQRCRPKYDTAIHKMNRSVRKILVKNQFNHTIKFRVKSFDSYFRKMLHVYNTSAPQITDILGLRVIAPFLEDLDEVVRLLSSQFRVIDEERKGAKHSFREFGYDSIHLLIDLSDYDLPDLLPNAEKVCEIQLRTILQEAWAEVEHELIYKSDFALFNETIKRKLASLNATLTLSDIIFQEIRDDQKEIQAWGEKRRESMKERILNMNAISLIDSMEKPLEPAQDKMEIIHFDHRNPLEKLLFEALSAHGKNDLDVAGDLYTRILSMRPDDLIRSVVYNHRGMVFFVQAEYRRAIHDFSRSIKYNPENFRAFTNRGLCYRMVQNYIRALEDFTQSLELNDRQEEGYYSRALTHYDLHDYTKALADCKKALRVKPEFVPAKHMIKIIKARLFE